MQQITGLKDKLFQSIDISSLAVFRMVFGAILCWEIVRYFAYGWIEQFWITPKYFFPFDGFSWLSPWEGNLMYVHFFMLGILAIFIMLGLFYRISTLLFFFGFTYVFLLDETNYLNHFYLISILSFLLIFVDAHKRFSIDTILFPQIKSDTIPAWMMWIFRFQLGIVYFFGGIAKINEDWLRGYPLRYSLASKTDFPLIGQWFTEEWMVMFFTYSGLLVDLLIVPFLLWRKTRLPAFAIITLFHLINSTLFSIGIFPWLMIFATSLFFEPDWFRIILSKFNHYQQVTLVKFKQSYHPKPFIIYGLVIFVIIQCLLPLRHFFMESYVSWTEVGHNFSWHMKLRHKNAKARFLVVDLKTGEEFKINPKDFLAPRQYRKMSTRPRMILKFAHILDKEFEARGYPDIAVFGQIEASLNGRHRQPLIRPEVDLLSITSQHSIYDWVSKLEEELPIQ